MTGATIERARAAKTFIAALLEGADEICGIGIALLDDGYGVRVNVSGAPAAVAAIHIPQDVDGVPIVVTVISEILPL